jgi:cell division septal protein FtsQ
MPEVQQQKLEFPAASKSGNSRVRRKAEVRKGPPLRFWFLAGGMVVSVVLLVFLVFRGERYLIRDERFLLGMPPDPGQEVPGFQVHGLKHASRERVLQVFDPDFGRSVYLLPLRERRERLLRIDWIREASVYRIWPNRIQVDLSEREPVAYLQLPAVSTDGQPAYSVSMIDADGVLLTPPRQGEYNLPVLTGISVRDSQARRRDRVHQMLRLLNEAAELAGKLSEIDVSDIHNLKVTQQVEDRVVTLMLGDQNFKVRLQNFFNHFGDVQRRVPGATMLDLRLEDRITVVGQTARR